MADIVENIIIKDEISPSIEKSLDKIAVSAEKAEKSIIYLSSTLGKLHHSSFATPFEKVSASINVMGAQIKGLNNVFTGLQTSSAVKSLEQLNGSLTLASKELTNLHNLLGKSANIKLTTPLDKIGTSVNGLETKIKSLNSVFDKLDSKDIDKPLTKLITSVDNANTRVNTLINTLNKLKAIDLSNLNTQLKVMGVASNRIRQLSNHIENTSSANQTLTKSVNGNSSAYKNNVEIIKDTISATERATLATNVLTQAAKNAETAQVKLNTAITRNHIANAQLETTNVRKSRQEVGLEMDNTKLKSQNVLLQQRELRLQRMQEAQTRATQSTKTFNASLAGATRAIVIGTTLAYTTAKIAAFGDASTRLANQLTLIETSATAANKTLLSLTQVANNSYSDVDATVRLYVRLAQALDQVGATRAEAQSITETLSKTVQLAGLTGAEASAALLQISQAFNKGKLDGDEFRTVMETMPTLADAMAKELNTTRGALLKLAPEGKITAEVMRKSIATMADTIDYKFSKITPTVSQAFTEISNNAKIMGGELWKQLGAADALRSAFSLLANNMETVIKVGMAVGVGMLSGVVAKGAITATTAVVGLTKGTITLRAALMSLNVTPIGLLATAFSVATYAAAEFFGVFDSFGKDLNVTNVKLKSLSENLADVNGQMHTMSSIKLGKTSSDITQLINTNINGYKSLDNEIKSLVNTRAVLQATLDNENDKVKQLTATQKALREANNGLALSSKEYNAVMLNAGKALNEYKDTSTAILEIDKKIADLQGDKILKADALANEYASLSLAQSELSKKVSQYENELKGKTDSEIKANTELARTQELLKTAKIHYETNTRAIEQLKNQFSELGITYESVAAKINKGDAQKAITLAATNAVGKLDVMIKKLSIATEKANAKAKGDTNALADIAVKEAREKNKAVRDAAIATEDGKKKWNEYEQAVRRATIAENSNTVSVRKRKSELDKATGKCKEYIAQLDKEHELLTSGYKDYEKYRSLYKNVYEWRQKGLELSQSEINALKQKIDANRELMEQERLIQSYKDNSYAKQEENNTKNINAFLVSNPEERDKNKFANDQLSDITGETITGNEYYSQLQESAEQAYSKINELRQADLISTQTAYAAKAQIFAKQQQQMIAPVQGALGVISQLQSSNNKKLARVGKAAAIANAIMQTYTSATAAYASAAAIPYVGWVMAPAAAAAAVAVGMANVASIRSQPTGYKQGGFTGYQGIDTIAGVVHGNEFVMDRESTRSLGVENLEALRRGTATIETKKESNKSRGVNVTIQNYGSDKEFEVNTLDTGDVEIICRDIIRKEQGNIVKSYLTSDEGQEIIARTARRNN